MMTDRLNALTAATKVLRGDRAEDPGNLKRGWQEEAWGFYDEGGPLSYGVTWSSNMVSKARLFAATRGEQGDQPEALPESHPASEAVDFLAGGVDGQSSMLESLAVHLSVPGIGYLIGRLDDTDSWEVISADGIRLKTVATPTRPAVFEIQRQSGAWEILESDTLVVKVWRPHKRFPWEADSPARKALTSLRELRRTAQYIDATLVSRLSGAGFLVIPAEASFPTAPGEPDGQHPFITEVKEVMMTAVKNPGTASQIVPIPIVIPGEHADKFKLLNWETQLSERILDIRESALRHASVTLDIPAEILTGMGDINHWGQWQIEESAIKVHAEPLLEVITSALTRGFLHPVLEAQGVDPEGVFVWADTSDLTGSPDQSENMFRLYDRGEASGEALRRAVPGANEGDEPDEDQLEEWAVRQQIRRGAEPIGLEVTSQVASEVADNEDTDAQEITDIESQSGAEQESAPRGDNGQDLSMSDVLVFESYVVRALDVAKNRVNGGSKTEPLAGAWDRMTDAAIDLGYDPALVVERVSSYAKVVLEQGLEYDRNSLINVLNVE